MNKLKSTQKTASYLVIGTVMWEFFSYYGMQAILILYLTQKLNFSDAKAYAVYSGFTSLMYVTPIIGGWLADRYCGYRYAALWGSVLIILGHLSLSFATGGLYAGLTFLILGIGLFKSNTICLIGDCYPDDTAGRSMAFTWYYVSGNVGALSSQLLCPYLAQTFGWHYGFILAAIGMAFGFIMLIMTRRYFQWYKTNLPDTKWTRLNRPVQTGFAFMLIALSFLVVYFVLNHLLVGDLLIFISLIAAYLCFSIYRQANPEQRKMLRMVGYLTIFSMGFWIFDQQGSSSISLFIGRFIDRTVGHFTIPTGSFQAINPGIILVFGAILACLWRILDKRGIRPTPVRKVSIGILFLTLGFFIIAYAANIANVSGTAAMMYPIAGLILIGAAEMFVDPVMLGTITSIAPPHTEGRLIAVYYLASGAIANFLAGKIADLTIDPTTDKATALTYHQAYMQIAFVALGMFIILLIWAQLKRRSVR